MDKEKIIETIDYVLNEIEKSNFRAGICFFIEDIFDITSESSRRENVEYSEFMSAMIEQAIKVGVLNPALSDLEIRSDYWWIIKGYMDENTSKIFVVDWYEPRIKFLTEWKEELKKIK